MSALKYIGKDRTTDWLPGVPARDLSAAEAKQWPEAAASEFYVAANAKPKRKPRAKREVTPEPEASSAGHDEEEQEN